MGALRPTARRALRRPRACSRLRGTPRDESGGAGEPEGVTLIEAIKAGRIPRPAELTFGAWQAWRKAAGRRPTARRDGRGLLTHEEVALWREVMAHFYGEEKKFPLICKFQIIWGLPTFAY